MKSWSGFATLGLVVLMTLNIAGTAYYVVLQEQIRRVRPQPTLAEGGRFPAFSGVDVRGVSWESQGAPCRLIRIVDDRCAYCKKDKPAYEELLGAARLASCEIIELAPQAGGIAYDPRPGVVQLKFIDADVGAVLFPFATPQTVIVDGDWLVRMTRRGTFDEQSLASTLALLGSLAATHTK